MYSSKTPKDERRQKNLRMNRQKIRQDGSNSKSNQKIHHTKLLQHPKRANKNVSHAKRLKLETKNDGQKI